MSDCKPRVTVIIPCRNEAGFIGPCLDSIINTTYPKDCLEVFVVDGDSEDASVAVAQSYATRFPHITVLNNPKRITAAAMNIGIRQASGDFIIWLSAHSVHPPTYIEECVHHLLESRADAVGGRLRVLPRQRTALGRAIAAIQTHPLAVGRSRFRTHRREDALWVDATYGTAYRREVFQRVGLFNEKLVRSQDYELAMRLRRAGGRILLVPTLTCTYFARSQYWSFLNYSWSNGVWVLLPFLYSTGRPVAVRHLAPLLGLVMTAILAVLSFEWTWPRYALVAISAAYAAMMVALAVAVSRQERRLGLLITAPVAAVGMHLSYGLGSVWGLLYVGATTVVRFGGGIAMRLSKRSRFDRLQEIGAYDSHLDLSARDAGIGERPFVSVVIPCRNEEAHIGECVLSVLHGTYPVERLEILVVDGMSTDATRDRVREIEAKYPQVVLVDNPRRITPAALNIGIAHARGDLIQRLDAHARYAPSYIEQLVNLIQVTGVDCVGGVCFTRAQRNTYWAPAIEFALSHGLGVGASVFRTGAQGPRIVDTVPFPLMTRRLIESIGPYNELLQRSQDWDYSARIRASGSRILLDPRVHATYLARAGLWEFARHNVSNGLWVTRPWWIAGTRFALRHVAPVGALLGAIGLLVAGIWYRPLWWLLLILNAGYIATILVASIREAVRSRIPRLVLAGPLVLATLHLSYGIGSLWGLLAPGDAQHLGDDYSGGREFR